MSTCKTCSGKTYEIKKKVNLSISVDWSTTNISNIPYVRKKNQCWDYSQFGLFFLLCKIFLKMVKLLTIIVSHHRCDLCFMRPRGNHQSFNQNRLFTCFVASAAPLLSSSTQIGFVFQRWGWGASGLKFLRELCQNRRCDLQFSS